jgi:hypothetical protein
VAGVGSCLARFNEEGRAKVKQNKAYAHRAKVLRLARSLARSGQHDNHTSIVAELELVDGFADAHRCLVDRVITAQLDRLCAMAQTSAPASARDLAAFLANMRAPALTLHDRP